VDDWEDALEAIDSLVGMIDDLEESHERTYERGLEFFEDVREKAVSMSETITEREEVTERQSEAIAGWTAGVQKWHPDYK